MSLLENQTIFFLLFVSCVLVTSDIYKSVMWTTNNPLFSDSDKLSHCFGEDLEMRVHLQSSLPIVCPFDFIIMKTLASKPATGVLFENFWIVYDEESFRTCDINMTYYKDGNQKDRNRKLLECDSPEALKSFTYSIDFKAKTPANSGISFVGGEYYYFLATSDGTDGSLNNTRGGHCNDPKVRMKFKVYICKTQGVDEKCQNVPIGEFLCPSDLPKAATTSPPTTVTSQQITNDSTVGPENSSTIESDGLSTGNSGIPLSTMTTTVAPRTTSTSNSNNTLGNEKKDGRTAEKQGSQDVLDELSWWKTVAIVSFCFWALLVFFIVLWYIKRRKQKPGLCFTDINRVTPPADHETEPQSPDYDYTKTPNTNNSFNNLSYSDDSEDGKSHFQEMASFKPNNIMCPTPAVDKPDKQTQEKNDMQEKEPEKPHPGMKSEKIGNGTYGGKESGEKKQHKHMHKDENRNSQEVRDVVSLPALKNGVVLKKYSPSPEKRMVEVNGGYLNEDHV